VDADRPAAPSPAGGWGYAPDPVREKKKKKRKTKSKKDKQISLFLSDISRELSSISQARCVWDSLWVGTTNTEIT
jgi:hypothetical protein